jgi:hypothetical protein
MVIYTVTFAFPLLLLIFFFLISHGNQFFADSGFQARGGALKKIAPSGGRSENIWGISCEKSRFYAKKSYFFQF